MSARALWLALLWSTLLALPTLAQEDRPFVRHPAVSPDGQAVAFSYQGDIWTVSIEGGRAYRLTLHEAYEAHPVWSPDGQHLAFSTDRYGHDDVFVMGADGSNPRRLTYHSADDVPSDWTRDGRILFTTRRTFVQVEREREIYHVPATGGTPDRLLGAVGYAAVASPDGRFIAFERGSNSTSRKDYRGPANKNVWLYDTQTDAFIQLTEFDGNDYAPAWADAGTLLYLTDATGTYNLHRLTLTDDGTPEGDPEALTSFVEDGPRTFSVTADGQTVAFERQTDAYVMALGADAEPQLLTLAVPDDDRYDPIERETFTSDAEEYAVSPSGDYVAFVVRGEVFVTKNDPESDRTVRLTRHAYRDRDVAWLSDSTLVFASDRAGQYDLYRLESADPEQTDVFKSLQHRVVRLTETPEDERGPVVAPEGEQLAYTRGRGQLVVADVEDGQLRGERLLLDGWATPGGVTWSPDGQWLAYSLDDLTFNEEVYVHPLDGRTDPVNVSQHPKPDRDPVWSPDGRKLGFVSDRSSGDADIWYTWLREADWQKTRQDWEDAEELGLEEDEADSTVTVEIDLEGIHDRLVRLTALPGGETNPVISQDGETFYFVAGRGGRSQDIDADQDLHKIQWDGTGLTRLTEGDASPYAVRLGPDGEYLFMLQRGRLARLGAESGKKESLGYQARMDIDYAAEREQIFNEAWRVLNAGFYDPGFHGVDWTAMKEKYGAWAAKASTNRDFRDVFNLMLGELNASHLGLYGSDRAETQRERTGLLGVEVDPADEGVRVARVVPGSPADRADSRLAVGDVITAVDGEAVAAAPNFYALLADRVDDRVRLTVEDPRGTEREVVIRPTGSLSRELYEEWVEERARLTERYSGGRLGYIHIQGMNWPSFERFERELVASGAGKDGLIIDVRYNGGGWTTDYLMAVLTVRQHAYTIPRGAADDLEEEQTAFRGYYPYGERLPLASWTGPVAALCNANSYSNAEIFSHAFKNLGLGPLVGTPTFGAVISTGGAGLIDGSFVRLPFRGWYVKADDMNMENGPAVPDVIVDLPPGAKAAGNDPQLAKAVEVLLQQIDGRGDAPPAGGR